MAVPSVLSNVDIQYEIEKGGVVIPDKYRDRIKTASVDMAATGIRVIRGCKRLSEVFDGHLNIPLESELPQMNLIDTEPYDGILRPGSLYYSEADVGMQLREGIRARITTRSSLARHGLFVASPGVNNGATPIVIKPYAEIDLPSGYPICQAYLYTNGIIPLSKEDVIECMNAGEIMLDGEVNEDGSVKIHFNGPFLRHEPKKGCIDPRYPANCHFINADITKPLSCGVLYLAMTQDMSLSDGIIGVIEDPKYVNGRIHANAPVIKPGSRRQQTLELIFNEPYKIREGDEAGSIKFYRMKTRTTEPYHVDGKYGSQTNPLSNGHRDFPQ